MVTETSSEPISADDLLARGSEGVHGELIRGTFCELMPPGVLHAWIVARITGLLYVYLLDHAIGTVLAGDHGVLIERDPDTVIGPDVAFYSIDTMPLNPSLRGYTPLVPDLVVEVRSPSDRRPYIRDKANTWLNQGARIVWVVLPETRQVDVYRSAGEIETLTESDDLVGADVLPGFRCRVSEIFPAAQDAP